MNRWLLSLSLFALTACGGVSPEVIADDDAATDASAPETGSFCPLCIPGAVCVDGACVLADARSNVRTLDEACSSTEPCADGLTCARVTPASCEKKCAVPVESPANSPCASFGSVCPAGYFCNVERSAICVRGVAPPDSCGN